MTAEPLPSTPVPAGLPPALDGPATTSRPRAHQVAETLRTAIIAGRFEPGERLIEATLSAELGTSRGPVREALRQLENEGLILSLPYRGAVVLGVSDDEVQNVLIPIRLTVERHTFARALDMMTDDDFAEMAKQVWLMEQAARASDLVKAVEADLKFHDIVISASGQTHTLQIWRGIWPRIRAYFFRYGRGGSLDAMANEHRELLEAMQTRDVKIVLDLLERHIAVPAPQADAGPAAPAKRRKPGTARKRER